MARFKAAAKLALQQNAPQRSQKAMAFEMMKDDLKQRRQSKCITQGDFNSKYEMENEMDKDVKNLYNFRYGMDDEELENCESGLDALDEEDDESDEDQEDSVDESETEEQKKNEEDVEQEEESDSSIPRLDSDIEEMIKEKEKLVGEVEDDDEEDDLDIGTDEELGESTETENNDYDDLKKESPVSELDLDIRHSNKEQQHDSDASTNAGMPMTTNSQRDIRCPTNNQSENKERDEKADIVTRDEIPMTYSKSITSVEEFEGDVFDQQGQCNIEDVEASEEFSEDSENCAFSIPRISPSRKSSDIKDLNQMISDILNEYLDSLILKEDKLDNIQSKLKNETGEKVEQDKIDCVMDGKSQNGSVSGACQTEENENDANDATNLSASECERSICACQLSDQCSADKLVTNMLDTSMNGNIANSDDNNNHHLSDNSSIPSSYQANDLSTKQQHRVPYKRINTYQKCRNKNKRILKRKEREVIYERLHKKKCHATSRRISLLPESEIPSYKAFIAAECEKIDTVNFIISNLLSLTENMIEEKRKERERQEKIKIANSMLDLVLENVDDELRKKEEKKDDTEMVKTIIEDVLDMWECEQDAEEMIKNENLLEEFSVHIIESCLLVTARDVTGNDVYVTMLHKEPVYSKVGKDDESFSKQKRKKCLTKNQRFALISNAQLENDSINVLRNENINHDDDDDRADTKKNHQEENDGKNVNENTGNNNKNGEQKIADNCDEMLHINKLVDEREIVVEKVVHDEKEHDYTETKKDFFESDGNYEQADAENAIDNGNRILQRLINSQSNKKRQPDIVDDHQDEMLQGKEEDDKNSLKESCEILESIPKANKKEYCRQWLMENCFHPSPPEKNCVKKRHVLDARVRRYKKFRNQEKFRPTSATSDDSSFRGNLVRRRKTLKLLEAIEKFDLQNESSLSSTGRETPFSVQTRSSITSLEVGPRVIREPLQKQSEKEIRTYFDEILEQRICKRDKDFCNRCLLGIDKSNDTWAENIQGQHSKSYENAIKEVVEDELIDLIDDDSCIEKYEQQKASISSDDTIWPRDSPFVENNERFDTPESEIEQPSPSEEEPSVINSCPVLRDKQVRKSSWNEKRSLIRWNCIQPVIKPGMTSEYYHEINTKIKRAIFNSLTLQRPKCKAAFYDSPKILDLNEKEIRNLNHNPQPIRRMRRSQKERQSRSYPFLPALTDNRRQKQEYKRRSLIENNITTSERIKLPDIHRQDNDRKGFKMKRSPRI